MVPRTVRQPWYDHAAHCGHAITPTPDPASGPKCGDAETPEATDVSDLSTTSGPRRSGQPRTPPVVAAMTHEATISPRNAMRRRAQTQPWQVRVMDYDRNGPGVAGYYLDVVALMAAMCPMYASVRSKTGEYTRSDDPVLHVAVEAWRGTLMSQTDLQFFAVRGRESLGRIWHIQDPETGYNVTTATKQHDDHRIGFVDLYGRQRIVSKQNVWMSWVPDPYEMHEATSPMRRSLGDLKRLRSFLRNQNRSSDSRLLTNGIVSFPTDQNDVNRPYKNSGDNTIGNGGSSGDGSAVIDDFMDIAKLAHSDLEGESPASMVPFPHKGPAPIYTELGRLIDPVALEAETKAIEAFARSVNFPQQLLTMGPGASNHWNEFLTQETSVKIFLAPKLAPICNDVTEFHLRPMIEKFRAGLTSWESIDPRHVKIEFDLSFLLRRPRMFTELFQAYQMGWITREQGMAELSVPGEMLQIPTGMSEYEHWQLATGNKGAPYAETDGDNNLIVPDPNAMGGMPPVDPMADPNAAPTQEDAGGMVAEALGIPSAGGAPPDPAGAAVAEPGLPVAAALDPVEDVSAELFEDASKQDVQVAAELTGVVNMIIAAAQAEIARQIIVAHPARSEKRRELAALPVDEVWDNADPTVKANFDVDTVLQTTIERYRPQIEQVYADAAQTFLDKWGPTIAAILVTGAVLAATDALLSGLYGWASGRFVRDSVVNAGTLTVIANGVSRAAKPPASIVRESMVIAGGAQTDRNGRMLLDAGNNPSPVAGGEWKGNTGWLTGHNVTTAAPTAPVAWRWHHSWFRTPVEPFEPHRVLDGRLFDSPGDVPGGLYPGDHPNCGCGITPEVR